MHAGEINACMNVAFRKRAVRVDGGWQHACNSAQNKELQRCLLHASSAKTNKEQKHWQHAEHAWNCLPRPCAACEGRLDFGSSLGSCHQRDRVAACGGDAAQRCGLGSGADCECVWKSRNAVKAVSLAAPPMVRCMVLHEPCKGSVGMRISI